MEISVNFVDCFQIDVISKILSFLDDSADLIRASAVSRSWRLFVISNCLSKKLCMRKVPSMASIANVVEENDGVLKMLDVVSRNPTNWETLEREHKIYTSLLRVLENPIACPKECLAFPIGVSSTDRDPAENVINTLDPVDRYPSGGSRYWSSVGQSDPNVPEHILYLLKTPTCIVTEINIRPFEVFWEPGSPVYSAKSVRFRMSHPKALVDLEMSGTMLRPSQPPSLDKYVWTYTSPEFPMAQESRLQQFKLPKPTICMGGYLLIELLGRAQREEIDGLFYICLGHISVMGRPLEPAFSFDMLPSGEPLLKYCPYAVDEVIESFSDEEFRQLPSFGLGSMNRAILLRQLGELMPMYIDDDDDDPQDLI